MAGLPAPHWASVFLQGLEGTPKTGQKGVLRPCHLLGTADDVLD